MSKIYVVMGTTGEYSDRSEWPVKAFTAKLAAEQLIVKASAEAHRLQSVGYAPWREHGEKNALDPDFKLDQFTGTSYFHYEVELEQ